MFDNYVGQRDALAPLMVAITASRVTGMPLANMLFLGGPGRGKTTLAKAVAKETGQHIITLHGSSALEREDVASKIVAAQNGILFIDEVHALPRQLAEDLYRVIDEHKMTVMVPAVENKLVKTTRYIQLKEHLPETDHWMWHGPDYYNGFEYQQIETKDKVIETVEMDHITVIGATTDEALLPEPFYSRLSALTVRLREYTIRELETIAEKHARSMDMGITFGAVNAIAERSRKTPRRVEHLTAQAANWQIAYGKDNVITEERTKAMLLANGIDALGMEAPHRAILNALGRTDKGMSRTTLAQSIGIPPRNLDTYWGDLVGLGLVEIQTRHQITDKGREAI